MTTVPEVIRAMPAMAGYQLDDQAALVLFDETGQLIVQGVLPNGIDEQTVLEALTAVTQECQRLDRPPAGVVIASHSATATGVDHSLRCARIQSLLRRAGVTCQVEAWAVDGEWMWPLGEPAAMVPVHGPSTAATMAELRCGPPAATREAAEDAYHPLSGPLRDDLADNLPEVAAAARRTIEDCDAAVWRRGAITAAINRLSDPQPLDGPAAAELLLALSDPRVREHVTAHTVTALLLAPGRRDTDSALMAADTGHLSALVRYAPPGLINGPALLLSAALHAGGHPSVLIRAAAQAAFTDDTTCAQAVEHAQGAAGPDRGLLRKLAHAEPISAHDQALPAFCMAPERWPDPLAGYPIAGFDPLAGGRDPMGPAKDPLRDTGGGSWWDDPDPELGR